MTAALLIDFGSTYTKLRAVDLGTRTLLGSGQGPSTVTTDITRGMTAALDNLEQHLGQLPEFRYRLASSSAAGGLKMVTIGLVKELTVEAARLAALGAGARLVGAFAHHLSRGDIAAISYQDPDIILLAGGTDGGNRDVILHNAGMLAEAQFGCPVIVAGNRSAADEAADTLAAASIDVRITDNVMPAIGTLECDAARSAIREVFIDRIVHAKGLDRAQEFFNALLMPTPSAVLEAARLLSEGTAEHKGLGPLVVVDIGGATTDVHSLASGQPTEGRVMRQGLPEPYLKRTVEGDLGMRHNASAIVDEVGVDAFAELVGQSKDEVEHRLQLIKDDVDRLPETQAERAFDGALAVCATRIAVTRHAGTVEIVHTVHGPVATQRGKDLSEVTTVVGTGGALTFAEDPVSLMSGSLYADDQPESLRPRAPALKVDTDYVLFAAGLLAQSEPEVAFDLAIRSLREAGSAQVREDSSELRITPG